MFWEDRRQERYDEEPKEIPTKITEEYVQIGDEFFKISDLEEQPMAKAETKGIKWNQQMHLR